MRLSAVLVFALFALPAMAEDTIADQASAAFAIFAAGQSQVEFGSAQYGTIALKDIAGKWVNLTGPAPGTGIETYGADTERACKSTAALTLDSPNAVTLSLSAKPGAASFSQTYTLMAGSTFSQYTDPATYFVAIGLGPDKIGPEYEQQRALALSLANGIVQIYRPSEDILVLARETLYPTVLARCPA